MSRNGRLRVVHLFLFTLLIALFAGPSEVRAARQITGGSFVPVPSQLVLTVRETAGVARQDEVLRSGVPLPRSLDIRSTAGLVVVDGAGRPVPAEFKVTARWNAAKTDATAPVQWLLVSFPATVGANGTATYRIVTDGSAGSNPAPARTVSVTRSGNAVTVDTGAAVFRLGANSGMLFDEVVLDDGTRLIGGGSLGLRANGADWGHGTTRKVTIEHQGPLSAVVVIQGAYDTPAIGGGALSTRRRYVFTAGSPTAVVRHVINWEGNRGCNSCVTAPDGTPNGVLVERMRDELAVDLGGTPTVTAVGNFGAPAVTGGVAAGESAWVRQQLRASRTAPQKFDVSVAGATATGAKADGGVLAASGPRGTVAIALGRMHRYEPQALRLLAGGNLAVDVVDDKAWIAHHQGLFGTLAVTAVAGNPGRQELERLAWAPLNRPLHAWADAKWFAASDAVDDFPVGPLPAELASYDTLISTVLNRTVQKVDEVGLNGLTTFGVYPRYWGKSAAEIGEVECNGGGDPTPNEPWDNLFWCGAWTDYHNTVATAQVWAMRTGDVEWLDEVAFPGALRTLHTQIMQCGPTYWFYCGQAPTGYGAYRTDFNSSHAYFENLFLYYWMTGDETVVDIVRRGGENMRRYQCPQRGSANVVEPTGPAGPACAADYPITNATLTGRSGQQWLSVFRFLGHASPDGSFLEDFRSGFARAVTQNYAELNRNGVAYGFWGGPAVLKLPGTYTTDSGWTIPMYDMHHLSRLQRDTGDAPIGIPALKPSQVIAAVARTYRDLEPTVFGDGTAAGIWARLLQYTWSGSRLGGSLDSVVGADRYLYHPEKGGAGALLVRAGQQQGDDSLIAFGRETTQFMLSYSAGDTVPLGKIHGENLTRLHGAVARLAAGGSLPPPPPPPPPAPPVAPTALAARSASASEIDLTWQDNSNNETLFRVEQMVGGSFQEIRTVTAGVTSTRVTGLAASTAYTFRVRAGNGVGSSPYSNTASATTQAAPPPPPPPPAAPAAPSALTAQAASVSEIDLNWQDNSGDETLFRVEQFVGGVFQEIRTVGAGVTSTRVAGLAASTTYTFRVRAGNGAGNSAYSNTASATTQASPPPPPPPATTPPAAPTKLSAVPFSTTEVQLTWRDGSTNEALFRIEMKVGGTFREVQTVGANVVTARVTGLTPNTTYQFRVRAGNSAGNSAYTNTAHAKTPAVRAASSLGAPNRLSVRWLGNGTAQLSWRDNSSSETEFQVERMVNGVYQPAAKVGRNVTSARVGGLRARASYTFRVRVRNSAGQVAYSTPANVNTF
jgi:hypothetical protein